MLDGRHDLDLPPNADEVRLCLDLALLDRLDGHLAEKILISEIAAARRLTASIRSG